MGLNNFRQKVLPFLILITPILDWINGMTFFYTGKDSSVYVLMLRAFFVIILMVDALKFRRTNWKIYMILLLFLVQIFYFTLNYEVVNTDIVYHFIQLSKLLYFFGLLMYILNNNDISSEGIDSAIITSVLFISMSLIIQRFLNVGLSTYGQGDNAVGFKGFFIEQNAISNILVSMLPILILIYQKTNKKISLVTFFLAVIASLAIGTRISIVGCLLSVFLIVLILNKSLWKKIVIGLLLLFSGWFFLKLFSFQMDDGLIERQLYFFSKLDFLTYLTSGRNSLVLNKLELVKELPMGLGFIVGIGHFFSRRLSEMDIVDVLTGYGLITTIIIYGTMLNQFLKSITIKIFTLQNLACITFLLVSSLSGHVLLTPLSSIFFSITFYYVKNNLRMKQKEKKVFYGSI